MRIVIEAGKGNLNARAYVAAVVGPYRLAHGGQRALVLTAGQAEKIAANPGVAGTDQPMFIGVALQAGKAPVTVLFGPNSEMGNSSNVPANMSLPAVAMLGGIGFSCILLPGEELWVQSPSDTSLVAFTVGF